MISFFISNDKYQELYFIRPFLNLLKQGLSDYFNQQNFLIMKKLILALCILCLTSNVFTQETQSNSGGMRRGGGGAGNPRVKEALKQKLISELNLAEAQADSIAVIQMDAQKNMRALKMESSLSIEDKENKLAELKAARNKKLKALLTEEQIVKLQEMMDNMRKNREQGDVKQQEKQE